MKSLSSSIAEILGTQGIISKEDIEQCKYGLDIFISSFLEIISILVISAFVGNLLETTLLFAAFVPLRIYAGGYHADTKLKCYLISLAVYVIFTAIMMCIPRETYLIMNLIFTIFSLLMVFLSAPVVHKNKNVNENERIHYKKVSRRICITETAIIFLLTAMKPENKFVFSLACGQASASLAMLAAIIKKKLSDNK